MKHHSTGTESTIIVPEIAIYDGDKTIGSYPLHATIISPASGAHRGLMWIFHGFGAPGDDLVPVGEAFAAANGITVICLSAPLEVAGTGGGRSWWPMDMMTLMGLRDQGKYSEAVGVLGSNAPRLAADLLPYIETFSVSWAKDIGRTSTESATKPTNERSESKAPPIFFAGFSQGAMLAAELAWLSTATNRNAADDIDLAGLIVYSSVPYPGRAFGGNLPIFYSYGTADPYLQGDVTQTAIKQFGTESNPHLHAVQFSGGHTIPPDSLRQSISFVSDML